MRCARRRCRASRSMERKGVMPMPPARNTAGRAASACSTIMPAGPSIVAAAPASSVRSRDLKALSRMRVANISSPSCGAEAMVNVRLSPTSPSVTRAFWPAWKSKPRGLAKWNAIVPSATVSRRTRRMDGAATGLIAADGGEFICHFMALAGVVVPVELVRVLALRDLVRAVAVRLVLRQAAFAEPLVLAVDHVLRGLLGGASYEPGHGCSSWLKGQTPAECRAFQQMR